MYNFLCQNVLFFSIYINNKKNSSILGQMSQKQKRKQIVRFIKIFELYQVTIHPQKLSSVKST